MKRCPKCGSTYTDETLNFCLTDGTPLLDEGGKETEDFSTADRGEVRIDIPEETVAFESPAPVTTSVESPKKGVGAFLMGIVSAFVLLILVGGIGFAIYYFTFDRPEKNVVTVETSTPDKVSTPTDKNEAVDETTPTRSPEKTATPKPSATPTGSPTPPTKGNAVVHSPADGFLALRTLPNHKTGKRIAKIPHGSRLTLGVCTKKIKIGKRSGRWCRTSYGGSSGWVFDAWVRRSR